MISRRFFLGVVGGIGLIAATPGLVRQAASPADGVWRAALGEGAAVRSVGLECLGCGAAESDPATLIQALRESLADRGLAAAESDPEALRAALASVRRDEFAAGEVVLVDGWMLARSEARSYALAASLPTPTV